MALVQFTFPDTGQPVYVESSKVIYLTKNSTSGHLYGYPKIHLGDSQWVVVNGTLEEAVAALEDAELRERARDPGTGMRRVSLRDAS